MENLLEKLKEAVELGKVDKRSTYPPQLKIRMARMNSQENYWKKAANLMIYWKKH